MLDEQEKRSAMREEAASWFAAMQGPDAQNRDQEFKAWLAADPDHRIAYARIAEVYSIGKSLVSPTKAEADAAPTHSRHAVALAAAVAVILLSFSAIVWMPAGNKGQKNGPAIVADAGHHTAEFASRVGQIRKLQLADGSEITLDTDSIVSMRFTPSSRSLRLEQGKARFEVAHDKRPFIVSVGDAIVTAHGTVFDVGFRSDQTYFVRLLRGSVDVARADHVVGHDVTGSVAKIVKLEHAWRRLDGRNDDGFQVAPFPG
ncbi:FecR domain-containing protein [Sphingobium sp. SA2]|uniref:FecR domain-containing protein n=1 Tax=Sphingobium sp. SA2 TaxID=1524832 RepID=UPI0028C07B4E|nr:FecR domain-containing protein [Sphingobium sp. SA2]MDT7531994.1 FecR domain-containing protein [Sphingobium sp. SA2]